MTGQAPHHLRRDVAGSDSEIGVGRAAIESAATAVGIELGSTRIKACLIQSSNGAVLATGSHEWASSFANQLWTYPLDEAWSGIQIAYASLVTAVRDRYRITPVTFGAIGISAMMHGYLALDAEGCELVPFRTWRNTNTGPAAARLTAELGYNIPLRWSVAHLYQAILDNEPHLPKLHRLNTLAGYVHQRLTGHYVLGVGDASGMFPIATETADYDEVALDRFDTLAARQGRRTSIRSLLPQVLTAGKDAGTLTVTGARLLDPSGRLEAGIPVAPPEGDAGTGMVATNAISPRSGNVSVGTSVFAMVVLEGQRLAVHPEVDLVATPVGDAVAMVHCNSGANEIGVWAAVFREFAQAAGLSLPADDVFALLLAAASQAAPDAAGSTAFNYVSGEPIAKIDAGSPMLVRAADDPLTLATLIRAQLNSVFTTLVMGMEILSGEGVQLDRMVGHGGLFRTANVAQQILADALQTPVSVAETASEGGAWGMAVLAAYRQLCAGAESAPIAGLAQFLDTNIFAQLPVQTACPVPAGVAGFTSYLRRFRERLELQRTAPVTQSE